MARHGLPAATALPVILHPTPDKGVFNVLLKGTVAVITGGASGLGKAIAVRFAEEGAAAIIIADQTDQPREGGEAVLDALARLGTAGRFVKTDVSRRGDIEAAVAAADEFGGLSVMVNNAGVLRMGDFLDFSEEDYDLTMAVNAKGVFLGGQAAARAMIKAGRKGSIINMSSFGGILGNGGGVAYNASKGAVRLMTYAMAEGLGPHGIRVNAIHPGFTDTAMNAGYTYQDLGWKIPLQRAAQPLDIANAAVYLASPLSEYVTATSMLVDGGITNTI